MAFVRDTHQSPGVCVASVAVSRATTLIASLTMAAVCSGYDFNYLEFIVKFHKETNLCVAFLKLHCVLLSQVWLVRLE